jgi:amino acid permease
MRNKSNNEGSKAIYCSIFLTMSIYIILSIVSIYMFGSLIKSDVLDNVDKEKGHWESYILRVAFLVVIGCHIPFIFFSGKECFLTIIDELLKRSVSKSLER